ncbi:glycoside hydrolase family 32 protein [Bacillus mangrovi]|uniref:Glycoside hydrolase family 32 protein n=1 Tax=Metabacillus mangrovi TaxID=1491830 RepID=A0A7X2S8U1_9BACI|nr:glycoside hydrolase family 32 protein [Metabacillus mangrovi]MTH55316.1 glycoside hydrolase family 32 protein [Metabacillus mangrovi]
MNKKKAVWIAIAALVALFIGILSSRLNEGNEESGKAPNTESPGTKPAQEASPHRPSIHFSTPEKWKNDPQKPIFIDGKYHYYYLYNGNYPDGGGTEWRHAVSEDLVTWKDEGIAIPKFTNKNGDIWSGSVVEDKNNTAGFGEGAIIALVTQPTAETGKQEQYLWYSTDRGKTFKSSSDQPVLPNPGSEVFRDPKVIWDEENQKWMLLMAEGDKIGFYESKNLKDWAFTGEYKTNGIGLLECPDLFQMRAEDGTVKWVLGVSANGKAAGKPNTYAYWTGNYDGKTFAADSPDPEWLDYGFDWYGGVTFEDGKGDPLAKRYGIAWMNNWDYPHNTPTVKEGFNGVDSIVREIQMKPQGEGKYSLVSKPVSSLQDSVKKEETAERTEVNGTETLRIKGDSYLLEADLSWKDARNLGIRLRESEDGKRHIDAGFLPQEGTSYVNRALTGQPDKSGKYGESKAPFDGAAQKVHVKILVDKTTVEVFVDDGKTVHSNLAFPEPGDQAITLYSEGGPAVFENIKVKHF